MDNRTIWNQITEDSKRSGYHERLTPHICSLFRATSEYVSDLKANDVLDVGAGDKRYRNYVNCNKYISIDISGETDIHGDTMTLPFKNDSFDMIICTQVLEHIKNPFLAVEEFNRILRKGGMVFITVPTVMYLHETPNDYFRYTKYGIEYLLNKNNISIQNSETICSGFLIGLELFFIGIYSGIYKMTKNDFIRRLLISNISYLSYIALVLDISFFRMVFPGNIMISGYKSKDGDKKSN